MAIRYKYNVINPTTVPSITKETISLDSIRRKERTQLNRSVKLSKKIFGFTGQSDAIETFKLWDFSSVTGDEVVDYTFEFTGGLIVDDFGDGTSREGISTGATFTKEYS